MTTFVLGKLSFFPYEKEIKKFFGSVLEESSHHCGGVNGGGATCAGEQCTSDFIRFWLNTYVHTLVL